MTTSPSPPVSPFYAYVNPKNHKEIDWGVSQEGLLGGWSPGPWAEEDGGQCAYTPMWYVTWTPGSGESGPPPESVATLSVEMEYGCYMEAWGSGDSKVGTANIWSQVWLGMVAPPALDGTAIGPLTQIGQDPPFDTIWQVGSPNNMNTYAGMQPAVGVSFAASVIGSDWTQQSNGSWVCYLGVNGPIMRYDLKITMSAPPPLGNAIASYSGGDFGIGCLLGPPGGGGGNPPPPGVLGLKSICAAKGRMKVVSINGQVFDTPYDPNAPF